jgi:hypothetical protein
LDNSEEINLYLLVGKGKKKGKLVEKTPFFLQLLFEVCNRFK